MNITPGHFATGSTPRKVDTWTTRLTISTAAANQHHPMSTGIYSSGGEILRGRRLVEEIGSLTGFSGHPPVPARSPLPRGQRVVEPGKRYLPRSDAAPGWAWPTCSDARTRAANSSQTSSNAALDDSHASAIRRLPPLFVTYRCRGPPPPD